MQDVSDISNVNNIGNIGQIENELINKVTINLKVIQRNARQRTTRIEGLGALNKDPKFLETIAKHFRKKFNCSAAVDQQDGTIKCSGDHRNEIKKFLIDEKLVAADNIKVFGH